MKTNLARCSLVVLLLLSLTRELVVGPWANQFENPKIDFTLHRRTVRPLQELLDLACNLNFSS